jgi:hypothetical protein
MRHTVPLRLSLVVAFATAVLGACAPDAVTNRKATGFNAYLDDVAERCSPLVVGSYDMTQKLLQPGIYDNNFDYFFDLTSKLYYQRVGAGAYRTGINGFFGSDARTNASIDCLIANLPADRPKASGSLGGAVNVN